MRPLPLCRRSGTLGEAAALRTIQQRQPAKDARAVRKGGAEQPERRSDLLVARCETGRAVGGRAAATIGSEPWVPAEGGAGACCTRANADLRVVQLD